jgi:hypothetical protein
MSTRETFLAAIDQLLIVSKQYLNGDPVPFQACWSHADDVTIFGAWGAYERGWSQVEPRLAWGAARYKGGDTAFEILSLEVAGTLGHVVFVERGTARVVGQDEPRPFTLRVTQLYRWENDSWKIIHRHADAVSAKIEAAAVLQ